MHTSNPPVRLRLMASSFTRHDPRSSVVLAAASGLIIHFVHYKYTPQMCRLPWTTFVFAGGGLGECTHIHTAANYRIVARS